MGANHEHSLTRITHVHKQQVVRIEHSKAMDYDTRMGFGKIRCSQLVDCHSFCVVDDAWHYYYRQPVSYSFSPRALFQSVFRGGHEETKCFKKVVDDDETHRSVEHKSHPPIVISTEYLSEEERSGLLSMSDVLVHTSRSEGFVTFHFFVHFLFPFVHVLFVNSCLLKAMSS
jgi:glycosyltransferase involved in cell wall biosynthesis